MRYLSRSELTSSRIRLALAAGIFLSFPADAVLAAQAESPECTCTTKALPGTTFIGSFVSAEGVVQIVGEGDATLGTPVRLGSQILTGIDGYATLVVSTCTQQLMPNEQAMVFKKGDDVCISVSRTRAAAVETTPGSSTPEISAVQPTPRIIIPLLIGGAAAGVALGFSGDTLGGGDEPASN